MISPRALRLEPQSSGARSSFSIPLQTSSGPRNHSNGFSNSGVSRSQERNSRNHSVTRNPIWRLEYLKAMQSELRLTSDGDPRLPRRDDFPYFISTKIISNDIDKPLKHAIILLHHYGGTEGSLESLAKSLFKRQHNSAYILLRGFQSVDLGNCGYHWAETRNQYNEDFCNINEKNSNGCD